MMKRIHKTNKGFTLIEMVLVIAIIVILASVMVISISGYLKSAKNVKQVVSSGSESFSTANKNINKDFVSLGY